jgi:hypothetical protein
VLRDRGISERVECEKHRTEETDANCER